MRWNTLPPSINSCTGQQEAGRTESPVSSLERCHMAAPKAALCQPKKRVSIRRETVGQGQCGGAYHDQAEVLPIRCAGAIHPDQTAAGREEATV